MGNRDPGAWEVIAPVPGDAPAAPTEHFKLGRPVEMPPNYTIFGNLTGGEDVLDAIANSPVTTGRGGEPSTPTSPLEITDIEIQLLVA